MPARKTRTRKATAQTKAVAPIVQSVPVVESTPTDVLVKPDVTLLTNEQLWTDLKNRVRVHNYEFSMMIRDLKQMIDWTQEQINQLKISS